MSSGTRRRVNPLVLTHGVTGYPLLVPTAAVHGLVAATTPLLVLLWALKVGSS